MVASILVPGLDYPTLDGLADQDKNYSADLYVIFITAQKVLVALGKPDYSYSTKGIVTYPCYKIDDEFVSRRIGLYEIFSSNESSVTDEDGSVDISKIGPLLQYHVPTAKPKRAKADNWVNTMFKAREYSIVDNEGGGDCLFAAVRDGLETVGEKITVEEMRGLLAKEVTDDLLEGYRTVYTQSREEMLKADTARKELRKKFNKINEEGRVTKTAEDVEDLVTKGRELEEKYKQAMREYASSKELHAEYKALGEVKTLDDFKALIQSCRFWGDTWAVSTLERVLNIKLILLSKSSFREGDRDNVLTCGQMNDDVLKEKGVFEPRYYIILEYSGEHYTLVTYKGLGALNFPELPSQLVELISSKCLESSGGLYSLIPQFRELKPDSPQPDTGNTAIFQFHPSAAARPRPGKGAGEKIEKSQETLFNALNVHKNWRRKLALEHAHKFTAEGKEFSSGLHYYSYLRYKEHAPSFADQFSLGSNSELSRDTKLVKAAFSKQGREGKKQIRPFAIKALPSDSVDSTKLAKAQLAKFASSTELTNLLVSTKDAVLNEFKRGKPPRQATELMDVRSKINSKSI